MKKWIKITISICSTILLLVGCGILFSYIMLKKSLPDYEGFLTVKGLYNEVKIYRDGYAIPYIIANREEDAAFALGYVHAQERLFQMDLLRRAGEGRLSEIIGLRTVPYDKMFRTLGLLNHVVENYNNLSELSKGILEAYADGVNEFIDQNNGSFSIEFDLLNYDPYYWKPVHSLVIAKLLAWELNISWWSDISFVHIIQKLGVDRAKEIIPDFPENAPTIIPDYIESFAKVNTNFIKTDKMFREFMGFEGTHIGSNNWVVNSNLSSSRKPIIANDPHLAFSIPGKWYVAIIKSRDWSAEGFTIPGLPGIVIGKNDNIAWVVTNVMTDDADFYIEKLDSSKTKYLFKNKWNDLHILKDTIKVKDSADVIFKIRKTHRGPIISDIHPYDILFPNNEQRQAEISMNWTALYFSDELHSIMTVNKAEHWEQFKDALKYYTVPGQNFIYADKNDNIGYICATRLPIRKKLSPTLVYDGTTDEGDWLGFVPYDEMPKFLNPAENYIASANNKTIKNFRYHISNIWEPPSRIKRITELLNSKDKHSIKDFKNYQLDLFSHYAKDLTRYILSAFENTILKSKNLELALELFSKWDFQMDMYNQVPSIYAVFFQKLLMNIFEDELGENLLKEYVFVANVPYRIVVQLFESNNSSWFDNINTTEREDRDDIIRKSLSDALDELEENFGNEITYWQWRDLHHVSFKHPFQGISSVLDVIVNVGPYEIGGDGTTIFNTEYSFSEPYENKLGPSMRFLYDFSSPDVFHLILPTGQSGHILSDQYNDMTEMWLRGEYIKINTNQDSILTAGHRILTLIPKTN